LIKFYRVDSGNIYTRRTHIEDNTNLQSVDKIEVYLHVNSLVKHFLIPIKDLLHGEDYVYAVAYIKPDKSYKYVSKGIRLTHFDGYSNCKEFAKTVLHKPIFGEIDHRRTIYWNPDLMLDSLGKGAIEFYNNSSYHHILIEAQGLSNKGIPIEGKNY
jgi:hypothetical protein